MYQILRLCKFESFLVSRFYGNQRNGTHYDTLRIPSTSSQKEIRDAFIKLSKEMHPDMKGKGSHSEFVKVNEAYKTLSKENLRRQYDMNIKHGFHQNNPSYPSHHTDEVRRPFGDYEYYSTSSKYTNMKDWEENYYEIRRIKSFKSITIFFGCIVLILFSFISQAITTSKMRSDYEDLIILKSLRYEKYREIDELAKNKTREEQIRDFESRIRARRNR